MNENESTTTGAIATDTLETQTNLTNAITAAIQQFGPHLIDAGWQWERVADFCNDIVYRETTGEEPSE